MWRLCTQDRTVNQYFYSRKKYLFDRIFLLFISWSPALTKSGILDPVQRGPFEEILIKRGPAYWFLLQSRCCSTAYQGRMSRPVPEILIHRTSFNPWNRRSLLVLYDKSLAFHISFVTFICQETASSSLVDLFGYFYFKRCLAIFIFGKQIS